MIRLYEFKDRNNKIVYLTKEGWSHINNEHPEVAGYLKYFDDVLSNPTKIVDYLYKSEVKYGFARILISLL